MRKLSVLYLCLCFGAGVALGTNVHGVGRLLGAVFTGVVIVCPMIINMVTLVCNMAEERRLLNGIPE
jgi:hypothetical protein